MLKPLEPAERYEYTVEQKALEAQYEVIVNLLKEAGFPAVYKKYWVSEKGIQPGYISLEEGTTPADALQNL